MTNQELRACAKSNHVKQWQIAERIGVSEGGFSRWMRHELDPDQKQKCLDAIRQIVKERGAGEEIA